MTSALTLRVRPRTVLLGVFTGASVLETGLVTVQAWRGVPSHLNFGTAFDTAVSMTPAAGGAVIAGTVPAFGAALWGLPRPAPEHAAGGCVLLVVGSRSAPS